MPSPICSYNVQEQIKPCFTLLGLPSKLWSNSISCGAGVAIIVFQPAFHLPFFLVENKKF